MSFFLVEKFPENIISRNTEQAWLAYGTDLYLLDFWLWGELYKTIYDKVSWITQHERFSEEIVRKVSASFLQRVEKCASKEMGHFEDEI